MAQHGKATFAIHDDKSLHAWQPLHVAGMCMHLLPVCGGNGMETWPLSVFSVVPAHGVLHAQQQEELRKIEAAGHKAHIVAGHVERAVYAGPELPCSSQTESAMNCNCSTAFGKQVHHLKGRANLHARICC